MIKNLLAVIMLLVAGSDARSAPPPATVILDDAEFIGIAIGNELYLLRRNGPEWLRFRLGEPATALAVKARGRIGSPETEFILNGKTAVFSPFKELLYLADTKSVVRNNGPVRLQLEVIREKVAADRWTIVGDASRTTIQHQSMSEQRAYTYVLHWKESP